MSIAIPPLMARNVTEIWAGDGERWLARLPTLVAEVIRDWRLTVGQPYALTIHWVARVTRADGSPAVLKLGLPAGHLDVEAEALRIFDGRGAVRLLAHDPARGALLLERAAPGELVDTLVPGDDEAATAAVIGVGQRLHRPPPPASALPELSGYGRAFRDHLARPATPLPRRLVERAADLFDDLCASAPQRLVLHGDLHHGNVLSGRDGWLAIDPHGVIGDPGFECGALLYNPHPFRREEGLLALTPRRIEQLADGYGLPVDRVVAWGFVMGVLSEVWTAQGGGTPGSRALDVATMLLPRIR